MSKDSTRTIRRLKVVTRSSRRLDDVAARYIAVQARYLWPDVRFACVKGYSFSIRRMRFPLTFFAYNGERAKITAECFGWTKTPSFAISVDHKTIVMEFTSLAEDQLLHLGSAPLWDLKVSRRETIQGFQIVDPPVLESNPYDSDDTSGKPFSWLPPI